MRVWTSTVLTQERVAAAIRAEVSEFYSKTPAAGLPPPFHDDMLLIIEGVMKRLFPDGTKL